MLNWKIRVMKHWIKKKNNVSLLELMRVVVDLSYIVKGKLRCEYIKSIENFKEIKLKYCKDPIFIPDKYPLELFYLTLEEIMNKRHWHNYEFFKTIVKTGDVVLDCGAAEGLFTMTVKDRAKKVYAIEPLEVFNQSLNKTYEKEKNVEVINVALYSTSKELYLKEDYLSSRITNDGTGVKINVKTIDELFFDKNEPINYIKADLEGQELDMLKGAKNTIKLYKPKLAITTYHNNEDAELIAAFIKEIEPNYTIKLKGIQAKKGCYMMLHAWVEMD